MKYNNKDNTWYGWDLAIVADLYKYDEYLGDWAVSFSSIPVSVFKTHKPAKRKGHKAYFYLGKGFNAAFIGGMSPRQFKAERLHTGKRCDTCKEIVVSKGRHDFVQCGCGATFIDGGKCYLRSSAGGEVVTVDQATGEVLMIKALESGK